MDATMTLWALDWKSKGRSQALLKTMTAELLRFEVWLTHSLLTATHAECLTYIVHRRESVSITASEFSWRSMSSFFRYASEELGEKNPMERIKCPKRAEAAVKAVSEDEYRALLATCSRQKGAYAERDRALIALLWSTGLRRQELCNLTLDDVDMENGTLIVRVSKTKKPRMVPFSPEAQIAILKWLRIRARSPWADLPNLWLGKKGALNADGIRLMLERRSTMAGVKVSCHQFRRHFAASWLSNGGSQVSLQSICGWSSGAMPARYTRHAAGAVAADEYRRMYGATIK